MKKLSFILSGILFLLALLTVTLPLYAPALGLSTHRDAIFPRGLGTLLSDGKVINRYEYGIEGDQIVIVHGVPGSGAMMHPLAEALAGRGYQVTTYDRLGWAHSSARPNNELADPTSNAKDLIEFLQVQQINQPVLIGYSYGGGVVQEANRLEPEVAQCNVLVSSIGPGRRRAPANPGLVSRVMFSESVLRWALATTPIALRASAGNMNALYFPEQAATEQEVLQFISALEMSIPAWRRELSERFIEFDEFKPQLVRKPTLVLHGADDRTVLRSVAEHLHAELPDSQLQIKPATGHAMVLTRAIELAQSIDNFITRCTH